MDNQKKTHTNATERMFGNIEPSVKRSRRNKKPFHERIEIPKTTETSKNRRTMRI